MYVHTHMGLLPVDWNTADHDLALPPYGDLCLPYLTLQSPSLTHQLGSSEQEMMLLEVCWWRPERDRERERERERGGRGDGEGEGREGGRAHGYTHKPPLS